MYRYEQSAIVEDSSNFLEKMKELKPYMVEFSKDGTMKSKVYPPDCAVEGKNHQQIIIITHDKCLFFANDDVQKAWTRERNPFLRPKRWEQGIMVLEFVPSFGRFNLSSLNLEKRQKIIKKAGLTYIEAVKIFEYRKNNNKY